MFPLIALSQSRYVDVEVVDQYGNSLGTMGMMVQYTNTYGNGYEVAMDKYIQYLKEKESKERADKQRNALNQRLKSLGISQVPSWGGDIYAAALEGYASSVERESRSSVNEYDALIKKYNSLLSSYNKLKIKHDKLIKAWNSNRKSYNSSVNRQSSYSNTSNSNTANNAIAVTSFYLADSEGQDTELIVRKGQAIFVLDCDSSSYTSCKIMVNGIEGYTMRNAFKFN